MEKEFDERVSLWYIFHYNYVLKIAMLTYYYLFIEYLYRCVENLFLKMKVCIINIEFYYDLCILAPPNVYYVNQIKTYIPLTIKIAIIKIVRVCIW
jgi:hypothetical protein